MTAIACLIAGVSAAGMARARGVARTAQPRQGWHCSTLAGAARARPWPPSRAGAGAWQVLSRGEKLDLLVDKTDNLMFEVGASLALPSHLPHRSG